ncbi:hypothetical protein SDC9_193063 [bioreactor metagenome]|uniref:Uncharacterized protein n=1 Tax=bioreactor metagenome TaxID=1076179 RepID=A0A645I3P9_9ZZZZ
MWLALEREEARRIAEFQMTDMGLVQEGDAISRHRQIDSCLDIPSMGNFIWDKMVFRKNRFGDLAGTLIGEMQNEPILLEQMQINGRVAALRIRLPLIDARMS